jgi:hypothetical protein
MRFPIDKCLSVDLVALAGEIRPLYPSSSIDRSDGDLTETSLPASLLHLRKASGKGLGGSLPRTGARLGSD